MCLGSSDTFTKFSSFPNLATPKSTVTLHANHSESRNKQGTVDKRFGYLVPIKRKSAYLSQEMVRPTCILVLIIYSLTCYQIIIFAKCS